MLDPFTYWTRALSSFRMMGATGARMSETVTAAQRVVAARTETINHAIASPITGDYAELSKMVPEKVSAFGLSGSIVVAAWWEAYRATMVEGQAAAAMMLRGRPPAPTEMLDAMTRSSMVALNALEAGSKLGRDALAPVHKAATANARRLRKR